jgi:hypothetical protein
MKSSALPFVVSFGATAKPFEAGEVHALDVAADRAFAEAQRHPRLERRDDPRLHVGMRGQVEVEAVGPGVHVRLEPRRRLRVLRLQILRIDEELHPQVAPDLLLAFGLGEPALRVDEVGLDAVEVVFGLGVHQPEDGVGVGLRVDVRDAPVVAGDGDAFGPGAPRLHLRRFGRGGRRGRGAGGEDGQGGGGDEALHAELQAAVMPGRDGWPAR